MTFKEFTALFAGVRQLISFDFWFWFPAHPVISTQLVALVVAGLIHDIREIILVPPEVRNRQR